MNTGDKGDVWAASSPDLNNAEHHVAAVKNRSTIPVGFFDATQLKKIAKKNWANYSQESVKKGMQRMPKLLRRVIKLKGKYLTQNEMRGL